MPSFAAILPAAGSSTRYGGSGNKLFEMLDGRAVMERSIAAFRGRGDVALIVVPTRGQIEGLAADDRVRICGGGATRAHSVWNALREVPGSVEWVAVHDAARPLVSQALIDRTLSAAVEHGAAAVPALAVQLTIKEAIGPLPARVQRTIPRQTLWAMQTPQIARRQALLDAFEKCPIPLEQVTDDVQLIELAGGEVWLVPGEERNLKITTPQDMRLAEAILKSDS